MGIEILWRMCYDEVKSCAIQPLTEVFMSNPFLAISEPDQTEYLTQRVSLNRAVMAKCPVGGVEEGLDGKRFKELFSPEAIVAEMRHVSRYYGLDFSDIPDAVLPKRLDKALMCEEVRCRRMAERVVQRFGNRLGLLLLTLKTGLPENRNARPDWDDACWECWKNLDTVILTGGLASSRLGRRFKEQVQSVFDYAGIKPYNIMLFENGAYLGVMGLGQRMMEDNSASLVLDLGQTYFKRAVLKKSGGIISGINTFDSLPSRYMQIRFDDEGDKLAFAYDLHNYIINIIASTYKEASESTKLSDRILISIANYTHAGMLNPERGGYAKLSLLGENYADLLEEQLSGELRRRIEVRLVHDATATALYFSDIPNAVSITLGTGFGVGFPDIKL